MEKEVFSMPLRYKIDVLAALKEKGYNTNRIRTEGQLSQSTLQKFRNNQGVSWENLETLCALLECQPGDLVEYVEGVQ
jgi:putative transcriptional regulator